MSTTAAGTADPVAELYAEITAASSDMHERLALLAARAHGTTPTAVVAAVRLRLWTDYTATEPHPRARPVGGEERRRRGAVVPSS